MAQLKDLIVNGSSRFIGDVYATTFTGNLAGNASTATNATNAGMIAGLSVHSGRNNEANKIVRTDGNGYLQVGYINSSSGHEKNASNPTYVWGSNSSDSYLRSYQTSSLSVKYATLSGSCSGNAATATNASSAGDADKLDGYHLSQITPVVTKRDFTNGTLVKTNISFPGTNTNVSEPFLLTVKGNGYGDGIINFEFQGYVYYASSYAHPKIINSDFIIYSPNSIDKIYTMSIDNKLCFWWARQSYWQGFHIFCTTSTQSYQNRVIEVQDVSKPSGLFEQIYTPKLSLTTSNYTSYTVAKTGGGATGTWNISISGNAAMATNADTLDGQHNIEQVSDWNSWVGSFRISAENNVTNAPSEGFHYGYQMQFHRQPAVFYTDLITNLYRDELYFRRHDENGYGAWKQIAFLDSNVTSASKWRTARTITLTGSVTGSVSIDGSQNVSLATTTNHTHTFASLTSKPTTISGYGITDGLRRVTLANNVENDFNAFENLTLSGRGDPASGSSLLNSPWTTQPAGGFGVLTYLWSSYGFQLAVGYGSNDLYVRNRYYTGSSVAWDTKWDKILNSSNYNSYAPKLDGTGASGTWGISISGNAATATNADKLDGYHASYANSKPWGTIPVITDSGYMDVGKHFEFHYDNTTGPDYSTVLACTGNHRNIVNLPSKSGTLALLTDNVASATKLATSRTIWGQSFNGTGNVSGNLTDVGSITPATDNSHDIGTSSNQFRWVYAQGLFAHAGNVLRLGANNTDHMRIITNGNVGIGIENPQYKLHVVGTINASDVLMSQEIELCSSTPFIDFRYGNSTDNYTSRIIEGLSGQLTVTGKLRVGLGYTTSTNHAFHVVGDGFFTENIITESDFKSLGNAIIDGYVGIGTSSPSYKLHVSGSGYFTENVITGNDFISYGGAIIYGNVGIGTQRPDYNLDVDGNMRITGPI